ncbi:MAG: helix-turn-helix domain-containing protein [Ruminococcus flavefaciens]|nr:helix-turn-helix domain-containing protein [Ruminococcus flavefaciens]
MKYPNIEAERARKGLTFDALAKMLGVCRKTYYNWVTKGNIPSSKITEMSRIFGVSSDYLLGLTDQK